MRKPSKYFLVLAAVLILCGCVVALAFLSSNHRLSNIQVTNTGSTSVRIVALGKSDEGIGKSVFVNGVQLTKCTEDGNNPCVLNQLSTDSFRYYEISNLSPEKIYSFEWRNSVLYNLEKLFDKDSNFSFSTEKITEQAPIPTRLYGQVLDGNSNGIANALVLVKASPVESEGRFPTLSTVTNEDGFYSVEYNAKTHDVVDQELIAYSPNGYSASYNTISAYNLPVADVTIDNGADTASTSRIASFPSLVSKAYAGEASNSTTACFTTGMGGVRVQCGENVDWMTEINPQSCPAEAYCFKEANKQKCIDEVNAGTRPIVVRLGLIQHDTNTHFYPKSDPNSSTLRVYDDAGKIVVDGVVNGQYIELDRKVDGKSLIEKGKKYTVKAVVGGKECGNGDNTLTTILRTDTTTKYATKKLIDPVTTQVNMCQKFGENFGEYANNVDSDSLKKIATMNLSWALAIQSYDSIEGEYAGFVERAKGAGVTPLLRICDGQGADRHCAFEDGTKYGNKVVALYKQLSSKGKLPQNGLFIQIGHNEPNMAEYVDPKTEAKFIIDATKVIDSAGLISKNPKDSDIKLVGPSMDIYSAGASGRYTGTAYMDAMIGVSGFEEQAKKVYGWGANDYIMSPKNGDAVAKDVENYANYLAGKGLNKQVFVTEIGKKNGESSSDELKTLLTNLDSKDYVAAIFIFKGTNSDEEFPFNKDIYNKIKFNDFCKKKTVNVPQEGSSSVVVDDKFAPIAKDSTLPGSSTLPVAVKPGSGSSASPAPAGSTYTKDTYSMTKKVAVLVFNPKIPSAGNKDLVSYKSWNDPNSISDQIVTFFKDVSGNRVNYSIVDRKVVDAIPVKLDGTKLTADEYDKCWTSNTCSKVMADYTKIITDNNYCSALNSGAIDELWMWGAPWMGFYEANIAGGSGYDTNGPFTKVDGCNKPLHVMGFNYERGLSEAIEDFTHRTEGTMQYVYKSTAARGGGVGNLWEKFSMNSKLASQSVSGCGWAHYPPNGAKDYDWNNTSTVNTYCDQFLTTMDVDVNGAKKQVTCNEWGCNSLGYFKYFFTHMPIFSGTTNGVANDWWKYFDANFAMTNRIAEVNNTENSNLIAESVTSQSDGTVNTTANVLGAAVINLKDNGEYVIKSSKYQFVKSNVAKFAGEAGDLKFFVDDNGNGVMDAGEQYLTSAGDITVEKVGEVTKIDLSKGVNMFSVPIYSKDLLSAKQISEAVAAQEGSVTSVGTMNNSVSASNGWQVYTTRGVVDYSSDFNIVSGKSLYAVSQKDATVVVRGNNFASPVPVYLREGWNQVGLQGASMSKYADAGAILDDINKNTQIKVSAISSWNSEKQMYQTLIKNLDTKDEYGFRFKVNSEDSLFIYVSSGSGYWTPQ